MSEAEADNKDNHRDCDPQWTEARFLSICEIKNISPWGHFIDYLSCIQQ